MVLLRCIWLLLIGGCLSVCTVQADAQIKIEKLVTKKYEQSIHVSCEVSYYLHDKVKEALANGIMMSFVTDLELIENTPNWFNQVQARYQKVFSIKYHALSKQFVVSMNGEDRSYPDLFSVFYQQTRLCDFRIGPISVTQFSESVYVRAKVRLLTEALPLPLRVKSYLSKDWRPSSGWTVWPM